MLWTAADVFISSLIDGWLWPQSRQSRIQHFAVFSDTLNYFINVIIFFKNNWPLIASFTYFQSTLPKMHLASHKSVCVHQQWRAAGTHLPPLQCTLTPGVGFARGVKMWSASFNKFLIAAWPVRGFPDMCGLLWLNRLISNRGTHIYSTV